MKNLGAYKTLVFDCDGVVLNSNHAKSEAFRMAALPYGIKEAEEFVNWHRSNGGVSRYEKFKYFLKVMVPGRQGPNFEEMLSCYAKEVWEQLCTCEVAQGLDLLRSATEHANWFIVSGGDQEELRNLFKIRGIGRYFNGGIFGSPDKKIDILNREIAAGNIRFPAIFFGDSALDYQAASLAGLDFVFVSDWTEFSEWESFCVEKSIDFISNLSLVKRE